ncbi:SHOCT domain-containing protein [Haladaptatus sp. CMAA 1911]|uniref:SHOCT domain-containing protein n=1 Tax=unclassified Haladaptatus TaxID=2622732 RepID=UPI0037547AE8
MVNRPSPESKLRRWHRLVEHYTPDGALGRLLLSMGFGSLSVFFFGTAFASLSNTGLFGIFLFFPFLMSISLGALLLTVAVLWPVYLSLIGNVESARAYPESSVSSSSTSVSSGNHDEQDDAVEILKRKYAAGKVSESEFERRLETLLGTEEFTSRFDGRSRELERN